jgi:hypothetical protein
VRREQGGQGELDKENETIKGSGYLDSTESRMLTLFSLKNTRTNTLTAPLMAFSCKYEAYVIFLSIVSVWGRWQKSKNPPMNTAP